MNFIINGTLVMYVCVLGIHNITSLVSSSLLSLVFTFSMLLNGMIGQPSIMYQISHG